MIDPLGTDVVAAVLAYTHNSGTHVALDPAGAHATFAAAQACVRPHGTVVNVAAWEGTTPLDPMILVLREISVTGTLGYIGGDFAFALKLLSDGRMDIGWMISKRIRLDDVVVDGYEALINQRDDLVKVLVAP